MNTSTFFKTVVLSCAIFATPVIAQDYNTSPAESEIDIPEIPNSYNKTQPLTDDIVNECNGLGQLAIEFQIKRRITKPTIEEFVESYSGDRDLNSPLPLIVLHKLYHVVSENASPVAAAKIMTHLCVEAYVAMTSGPTC